MLPFNKKFDVLGCRWKMSEQCDARMEIHGKKGMNWWFKEAHLYRSQAKSLKRKCERMVIHVHKCGLEWKCESVLVTRKDEAGHRLGDSDDEKGSSVSGKKKEED